MENLMRLTSQHLPRLSALTLAAFLGTSQAADFPLGLSGTSVGAVVGSNATLTIGVNLSNPVLVDGLDVLFAFDPLSLRFDANLSTVLGMSWATFIAQPDVVADENPIGGLGFTALLPFPVLVSPATFSANLVFEGLQAGSHDVSYSLVLATDLGANSLSGDGLTPIAISPVPEPTPTALLLGGLAVLGWLAKRRAA
jgi:hypothetical protein